MTSKRCRCLAFQMCYTLSGYKQVPNDKVLWSWASYLCSMYFFDVYRLCNNSSITEEINSSGIATESHIFHFWGLAIMFQLSTCRTAKCDQQCHLWSALTIVCFPSRISFYMWIILWLPDPVIIVSGKINLSPLNVTKCLHNSMSLPHFCISLPCVLQQFKNPHSTSARPATH